MGHETPEVSLAPPPPLLTGFVGRMMKEDDENKNVLEFQVNHSLCVQANVSVDEFPESDPNGPKPLLGRLKNLFN